MGDGLTADAFAAHISGIYARTFTDDVVIAHDLQSDEAQAVCVGIEEVSVALQFDPHRSPDRNPNKRSIAKLMQAVKQ